ncbi:MAG: hypothetical protein IPM69_13740 [Ignavibacteria bacterium]|nr:hypothetical protein [Ignavibacteria bacterium]
MTQKHKFTKAQDEIKYRNDVLEIAGDYPNVAMILAPEYMLELFEKTKVADPQTTIFGIWNTLKGFSPFISELTNNPDYSA